jgi:hypothetical protein
MRKTKLTLFDAIMTEAMLLLATWTDGLFAIDGKNRRQEFAGQSVKGLASDGRVERSR